MISGLALSCDTANGVIEVINSSYVTGLSDVAKSVLSDENKAAIEDKRAAANALLLIGSIGGDIRPSSKDAIEAARAAYDALSDTQKELISGDQLEVLTNAEAAYDALLRPAPTPDPTPDPTPNPEPSEPETPTVTEPEPGDVVDNATSSNGSTVEVVVGDKTETTAPDGTVASGTVSISGMGEDTGTKLVIPVTVTIGESTYVVNAIQNKAFEGNTTITAVTIPETVVTVGEYAFRGCTSLKTVTVAQGVKEIGRSAFSKCANLKAVTLASSVTKVGKYAFYKTKAKTVTFQSKKLTKASVAGALKGSNITKVVVPKNKVKAYSKIFTKANCGKKVKVVAAA